MITLTGTYECKMDAKGRFMFPTAFKSQLKEAADAGFVIKRSIFRNCLELYPKEEWTRETERINQLNRFRKKNMDFIRKFMAGVKTMEADATGRLLIPKDLIRFASLKKELVVASVVNKLEVWDKSMYEEAVKYDPDEFAELAEEVMGAEDSE